MDSSHTYAEIDSTYDNISSCCSLSLSDFSPRRTDFECHLPIEYRYRRRSTVISATSSSSGYSSGSTSSVATVVNGPKPYRPIMQQIQQPYKPPLPQQSLSRHSQIIQQAVQPSTPVSQSSLQSEQFHHTNRPCCIECREKELRAALDIESHQYQNLSAINKPVPITDPYVFLMTSVLRNLRAEDGRKVVKVQQKLEKVLRFRNPRDPFHIEHEKLFEKQISCFGRDVSIRLQAISEVSPDTYRDVTAKFCDALHGSSNSKRILSLFKNVKNFLSF